MRPACLSCHRARVLLRQLPQQAAGHQWQDGHAGRHRHSLGTLTAVIATAQGLASGLPFDSAVAIAANAGAGAAAANGGDLSATTAAGYATIAGNTVLAGGSVSSQATALATHEYAQTARYFTEYPEDIQLFGVSFNTQLATTGIALQGEVFTGRTCRCSSTTSNCCSPR